jgi:hypothetical protein
MSVDWPPLFITNIEAIPGNFTTHQVAYHFPFASSDFIVVNVPGLPEKTLKHIRKFWHTG